MEVLQGKFDGYNFESLEASLGIKDQIVEVIGARLQSPYGTWHARGKADLKGELSLALAGRDLDLRQYASLAGYQEVSGNGYFAGRVLGTVKSPTLEGRLEARKGEIAGRPFDLLGGELTVRRDRVSLRQGIIQSGSGEIEVAGDLREIDLKARQAQVNAEIGINHFPLSDLAGIAGAKLEAGGIGNGRIKVTGEVQALTAQGELEVSRPSFRDYRFEQGKAAFNYQQGILSLTALSLRSGDSQVEASGQIKADRTLALKFTARDFRLTDLPLPQRITQSLSLKGPVSLVGQISGPYGHPRIEADIQSPQFTIQSEPFQQLSAALIWQGDRLQLDQVTFAGKQGRYRVEGWMETKAKDWELKGEIAQASLFTLRALVERTLRVRPTGALRTIRNLPRPMKGEFTASFSARGKAGRPSGECNFDLANAFLGGNRVPTLTGQVAFDRRVIDIRQVLAKEGPANAVASGIIDLEGDIALDIDIHNLQAQLFKPWIKFEQPLSGSADLAFLLSGPTRSPILVGSAEISDIGIGSAVFDGLRVARFTVAEQRVATEEALLVKGSHRVALSGFLPFAWSPLGIARDRPLGLTAAMKRADLGLVSALFPTVPRAEGLMEGSLQISGTLDDPQAQGQLTIAQGSLSLGKEGNRIESLQAELNFQGRQLQIASQGLVGGGPMSVKGTVEVKDFSLSGLDRNKYDLNISGQQLGVKYGNTFSGKVDVALALTNRDQPPRRPVLKGKIGVPTGKVGAAPVVSQATMARLPFNPDLEVGISVGPQVWLRSRAADICLVGEGKIAGQLNSPTVAAKLTCKHGNLVFPTSRFRITRGTVELDLSRDGEGNFLVRANLDVEAQGRVGRYMVYLAVSGPIEKPEVSPRSVPALSQNEIFALLMGEEKGAGLEGEGRDVNAAFSGEMARLLTTGLGITIFRPVEQALATGLGLEELAIQYSYQEAVRLRLGKYLGERLYLSYTTHLTGKLKSSSFGVKLEVTPNVSMGWSTNLTSLGVGAGERIDNRWEMEAGFRF